MRRRPTSNCGLHAQHALQQPDASKQPGVRLKLQIDRVQLATGRLLDLQAQLPG
jgi:hypothetical protein